MVELTDEEMRKLSAMHPPEVMRRSSIMVHRLIGLISGTAAIFALLEELGIFARISRYLWPGLLSFSGAFLTLYLLLHHGRRNIKLTSKAIWIDPQQRQHLMMGLMLFLSGQVELLRARGLLPGRRWGLILPGALAVMGGMFLTHPQHGTEEAVRESARYHSILGIMLVLTGLFRGFKVVSSMPGHLWAGLLLIVAASLVRYREPEGAYEKEHVGPH